MPLPLVRLPACVFILSFGAIAIDDRLLFPAPTLPRVNHNILEFQREAVARSRDRFCR